MPYDEQNTIPPQLVKRNEVQGTERIKGSFDPGGKCGEHVQVGHGPRNRYPLHRGEAHEFVY